MSPFRGLGQQSGSKLLEGLWALKWVVQFELMLSEYQFHQLRRKERLFAQVMSGLM
jgi:hypothetical protein